MSVRCARKRTPFEISGNFEPPSYRRQALIIPTVEARSESAIVQDVLTDALARFGCTAQTPPTLIGAGTLNHNHFVQTDRGAFVLRRIRDDQPDANVANEHQTIGWVAARGIPVPTPVTPTIADARPPDGELPPTCIRIESVGSKGATEPSRWALFPFVDGRRIARGELRANE